MDNVFLSMDITMAVGLIIRLVSFLLAKSNKTEVKSRRFYILADILISCILLLLFDVGRHLCSARDIQPEARIFFCMEMILHYSILILLVFDIRSFIERKIKISRLWVFLNSGVCIASMLLWCVCLFSPDIFEKTAYGHGALFILGIIGNIYPGLAYISMLLRSRSVIGRIIRMSVVVSFCPIVLFIIRFLPFGLDLSPLVLSLFIIMLHEFAHLEQQREINNMRLHLSEAKLSVMVNQTRPHFLYNTLNSIYYLCEKDPAAAQQAINDFAEYLRGNLESIETSSTVSFQKELEHVRHYLGLVKLRFQDDLRIEYNIEAEYFQLPPLSVQMMVENAVKHGLEVKPGGGTVYIASKETDDAFIVCVKDDGVGFDTSDTSKIGGLGITITRQRIETKCKGTLSIQSRIGEGTTAIIRIPKSGTGEEE